MKGLFGSCRKCLRCRKPGFVFGSKVRYLKPRPGSNVPREIINGLKAHPNKVLLVDGQNEGDEYTGQDIWLATARLASGLMNSGVDLRAGESVLMMTDHSVREKLMLIAALYTGAAVIGVAPSGGYVHLEEVSELVKPQVIVASNEQFGNALRLRRQIDGLEGARIILIEKEAISLLDHHNEEQNIFLAQDLFDWAHIDERLILKRVNRRINAKANNCFLMLNPVATGGSRPSIIPWTHEKQLRQIWSMISATKHQIKSEGASALLPIDEDSVLAANLPLDEGLGIVTMIWCLIVGAKLVVINSALDGDQFWRQVEKYRISASIGFSIYAKEILKKLCSWLDQPSREIVDVSSMKYIAFCGNKVNIKPLVKTLQPHHPNLNVVQFNGTSEAGLLNMSSVDDAKHSLDSVGCLFPGVKAKVVDTETGQILGSNEKGELLIRCPCLFSRKNVLDGEKVGIESYFDEMGFYKTGDLVHYDDHRRFYLHSRLDDRPNQDKESSKSSPEEIEAVINEHPMIDHCVVVRSSQADTEGDRVIVRAFIKLKSTLELEQLPTTAEHAKVRNLTKRMKSGRYDQVVLDVSEFTSKQLEDGSQLDANNIKVLDEIPMIGGRLNRKLLAQLE